MASTKRTTGTPADEAALGAARLTVGSQCMLKITGRHFLVEILETAVDTVRVSFPGRDYPVAGMRAHLEFYDLDGFYYYTTEVIAGPDAVGQGVVLRKPTDLKRNRSRTLCRVTTDLTVQVKDHVHARRYNGVLVDLSTGGALVETEAPFDFSTVADLTVSLPGEPTHTIVGHVVHVVPASPCTKQLQRFCMRFVDIEPAAEESIARYVRQRLQEA